VHLHGNRQGATSAGPKPSRAWTGSARLEFPREEPIEPRWNQWQTRAMLTHASFRSTLRSSRDWYLPHRKIRIAFFALLVWMPSVLATAHMPSGLPPPLMQADSRSSGRRGAQAQANVQLLAPSPVRSLLGAGHASPAELSLRQTSSDGLRSTLAYSIYSSVTSVSDVSQPEAHSAGTNRSTFSAHIGGGDNGFDAGVLVDVAHGRRWPEQGHGFVVRGGVRLRVEGNRAYYVSALQAPMLDVAYQFAVPGKFFELGARGGLLWDGRFRAEPHFTRNLELGPVGGAAIDLGITPVWTSARWLRSTHVSEFSLELCSQPGGSIWSMCMRTFGATEGMWPRGSNRRVLVGVLAVGLALPS